MKTPGTVISNVRAFTSFIKRHVCCSPIILSYALLSPITEPFQFKVKTSPSDLPVAETRVLSNRQSQVRSNWSNLSQAGSISTKLFEFPGQTSILSMPVLSPHGSECRDNEQADINLQIELERLKLERIERQIELAHLIRARSEIRNKSETSCNADCFGDISTPVVNGAIVERLELPTTSLWRFSGDPLYYCRFIRNFAACVEEKTKDNGKRLACLIEHCDGIAKCAIEDCSIEGPDIGYTEARRILKVRFGQNFMIARSHIDRLLKSTPINALQDLVQRMHTCSVTLSN